MKKLRKFTYLLVLAVLSATLWSCSSHDDDPEIGETSKRTVLMYLIATNSLNEDANIDEEEMLTAIKAAKPSGYRVLLYRVSYSHPTPTLLELTAKKGAVALKTYSKERGVSATGARLREVISDMRTFAPANEYGLILWSHSIGWAKNKRSATGRSSQLLDFGEDESTTMPIPELAEAIPDGQFAFISADACYMGSVEVAYELRKKTRYFIGSPTEVMSTGMPYDKTLPMMLKPTIDYRKICETTFNDYNKEQGVYRSCTISLLDCSGLDRLAQVCRGIYANASLPVANPSALQGYDFLSNHFLIDFLQFYTMISTTEAEKTALNAAYSAVVLNKYATPQFLGSKLNIDPQHFSGISTYLPESSNAQNEAAYEQMAWAKDVTK